MLRHPYERYERLYMYHLDCPELPPINDPDLIGAWNEDDAAVIFFHRPKEKLIEQIDMNSGSLEPYTLLSIRLTWTFRIGRPGNT